MTPDVAVHRTAVTVLSNLDLIASPDDSVCA